MLPRACDQTLAAFEGAIQAVSSLSNIDDESEENKNAKKLFEEAKAKLEQCFKDFQVNNSRLRDSLSNDNRTYAFLQRAGEWQKHDKDLGDATTKDQSRITMLKTYQAKASGYVLQSVRFSTKSSRSRSLNILPAWASTPPMQSLSRPFPSMIKPPSRASRSLVCSCFVL